MGAQSIFKSIPAFLCSASICGWSPILKEKFNIFLQLLKSAIKIIKANGGKCNFPLPQQMALGLSYSLQIIG